MSDSRWRQIEGIFHRALELGPEARLAFLTASCGEDAWLRREVDSLLAHEAEGSSAFIQLGNPVPESIAHYRITGKIGEGGMGAVYRATDTKLGREVAIKILPAAFALDPGRMARFQREAQVLASLNHPNIAAIYAVEDRALIMELVEGQDLRGRVPLDTALNYARQIAAALDAAHEKGIVHRDLKPANIRITPDGVVKVLDFGLAKPADDSASIIDTQTGAILGTPAYMAPELAQGKNVDKRADIWAFGVVLFEIIAGLRMFPQGSIADVLASVVRDDPRWEDLPSNTPAAIRKLLKRCLEKDPKRRLRDIGEARIAIEEMQSGTPAESTPGAGKSNRSWMAATVALGVLLAASLIWASGWFRSDLTPLGAAIFPLGLPEDVTASTLRFAPQMVPSPDGKSVAFIADSQGTPFLWVRQLASDTAQRFAHSDGAQLPFWSPDSKSIGFFAAGQLKRVSPGGEPQIVRGGVGGGGGTWNAEGTIVFATNSGLMRIASSGGTPSPIPRLSLGGGVPAFPQFLPDGKRILYLGGAADKRGIYVQELGSSQWKLVVRTRWQAAYASGYLLFVQQETLYAQAFDLKRLQVEGEPIRLSHVNANPNGFRAAFAVSQNGVLGYRDDVSAGARLLTWYDRAGKSAGTVGESAEYSYPALSPDGNWLAVAVRDQPEQKRHIFLFDLLRGSRLQLTTDPGDDIHPIWSPDGRRIAFNSDRTGRNEIYIKNPFGTAPEERITESPIGETAEDWSPDGRELAVIAQGRVSMLSLDSRKLQPYSQAGGHIRFSPDGKWVAYQRSQSGRLDVFVQPFPEANARWKISTSGGSEPIWRGDGRELFYASNDSPPKIMAVDMAVKNGAIEAGIPHEALSIPMETPHNRWTASRDGQRFLAIIVQDLKPGVVSQSIIYNWPALLKGR